MSRVEVQLVLFFASAAAGLPSGYFGAAGAVAEQLWSRVGVPGRSNTVRLYLSVHSLLTETSAKRRNRTAVNVLMRCI